VTDKVYCSFCAAHQDKRKLLIASGDGSYICEQCVLQCVQAIVEDLPQVPSGNERMAQLAEEEK
jgi:ATP-dependent protease Clp ATPase subunit